MEKGMLEIIGRIKDNWNDKEALDLIILEVIEIQVNIADLIARAEFNLSEAFVTERESMYKGNDSLARQKAKQLVGTEGTRYEYEFQAYTNLIQVLISHTSRLIPKRVDPEEPPVPLSEATSEKSS